MIESSVLKTVSLLPSLMVPPNWPWLCSGISMTTGWGVSGSTSMLLAPSLCRTLRANSMTAHCRPKRNHNKSCFNLDFKTVVLFYWTVPITKVLLTNKTKNWFLDKQIQSWGVAGHMSTSCFRSGGWGFKSCCRQVPSVFQAPHIQNIKIMICTAYWCQPKHSKDLHVTDNVGQESKLS